MGARAGTHVKLALAFLLAALAFAAATSTAHAAPLVRGFADDVWFTGEPAANAQWVRNTVATGARQVLLEVDWESIEPTAPAPPANPASASAPQYDFSYLDARVREFAGTGLTPVFLVTDAPRWAETPGGPTEFEADGAWEPNVTAFGQMATALASRYSGSYPDPLNPGHTLPRVRYFQAWGEANFSIHLAPQWQNQNGQWVATGPQIYRNLLNAFYAGIKSVHSNNVVISSGFGPYGDAPGACTNEEVGNGCRMPPAMFARDLMCLNGERLKPAACPNPAHFDVLAIDPYEVSSPTTAAFNVDDVTAPDLGKLTRVLKKAGKTGRALPRGHKPLWVTEFSYQSNPPNPTGVSLATQARWLEQSFYIFWREGVSSVFWYLVRDQAGDDFNTSYFSGVYFYSGTKKPAFEAYRFPFVVMPHGHAATAWGIAPRSGKVAVQHQSGRKWKTVFTARVRAGSVFTRSVSAKLRGNFRATVGGETSLTWRR